MFGILRQFTFSNSGVSALTAGPALAIAGILKTTSRSPQQMNEVV
jgi:hypothetical protein